MTLYAMDKPEEPQLVWEAFPSWAHFSWLYLVSAVSALRGALFYKFGVEGWEMWVVGAGMLPACAAVLRHWARYILTRDLLMVRNNYTGREIQSMSLSDVGEVEVRQGMVADFFGIGTVIVRSRSGDRVLSLRGVRDPEEIKIRIRALAWMGSRPENQLPGDS